MVNRQPWAEEAIANRERLELDTVIYERETFAGGALATITLNRPERLKGEIRWLRK